MVHTHTKIMNCSCLCSHVDMKEWVNGLLASAAGVAMGTSEEYLGL